MGTLETRICEIVKHRDKCKIQKSFTFTTPPYAVEDGYIRDKGNFCEALNEALHQQKVSTNKVIFSVGSTRIYTKEIIIPHVSTSKVRQIIETNISDYLPFSMEDYVMNYTIVEYFTEKVQKKEKKIRLMLIAVPDNLVRNYYSVAEQVGLTVESIDYNGNSVYQQLKMILNKEISLYIQMKDQATVVTIVKERTLILQRTISYGINELLQAVLESNQNIVKSEQEAYELLEKEDFITREVAELTTVELEYAATKEDSINIIQTLQAVSESTAFLVSSLGRVIDFYINQSGNTIQNIYVLGYGSKLKGMRDYIQRELGMYPLTLDELVNCKPGKDAKLYQANPSKFINCIGAIRAPIGFRPKTLSARKEKRSSVVELVVIASACVLGSGALYTLGQMGYKEAQKELKASEERLGGIAIDEETKGIFDDTIKQLEQIEDLDGQTHNHLDQMYELMGVLEETVVSKADIQAMNVTNEGISMGVILPSKEAAAKMILQLGTLQDYFAQVQISTVTERKDENGFTEVSFSISCLFHVEKTSDEVSSE